jgi:hypothetical protein
MVEYQARFLRTVAIFIPKATEMGFLLTSGEFWRPPVTAQYYKSIGKGISKSLHIDRLAADINAFWKGKYLDGMQDWHIPYLEKLGKLWESLDANARWGGRFLDVNGKPKPDYNHYSFEHNGVK